MHQGSTGEEPCSLTLYIVVTKEDRRSIDTTQQVPARYTGRSDYVGLSPTQPSGATAENAVKRAPGAPAMEGIQVTGETHELLEIHFTMAGLAYYTANRLTREHGSMLVRKSYYGDAADYWGTWRFQENPKP